MPKTNSFDPCIFSSFDALKNFFAESTDRSQILNEKHKVYSKVRAPLNPNLDRKWEICQLATAPFRWAYNFFIEGISKIASDYGMSSITDTLQLKTQAQYAKAGFDLYSTQTTKLFKIKTSINHPNAQGNLIKNFSMHKSDTIEASIEALIPRGEALLKFDHETGICRGMSEWFIYNYLNTKDQFQDVRAHMRALGKLFKQGGGIEPMILQTVLNNEKKQELLGLKLGVPNSRASMREPLHKFTLSQNKYSDAQMIDKIQKIPPGAYMVSLGVHMTTYIKVSDTLGFFFDPNEGIIEINGEAVGFELNKKIHEITKVFGMDPRQPLGRVIEFIPATLM